MSFVNQAEDVIYFRTRPNTNLIISKKSNNFFKQRRTVALIEFRLLIEWETLTPRPSQKLLPALEYKHFSSLSPLVKFNSVGNYDITTEKIQPDGSRIS